MARNFYINGETLVYVKFGDQVRGTSSTATTVKKTASELRIGDVLSNNKIVSGITELGNGQVRITFTDGTSTVYLTSTEVEVVGIPVLTSLPGVGTRYELGLSVDPILISLEFKHKSLRADDFGEVPPEIMWMMGTATIKMNLINLDMAVLDYCVAEAMGGYQELDPSFWAGSAFGKAPCGSVLGGSRPMFEKGNHFISLNLTSPGANFPWRFRASYLEDHVEYPLGTDTTAARLLWKAIPYAARLNNPRAEYVKSRSVPIWDHVLDN